MTILDVYLEQEGLVGTLTSDDNFALSFAYVPGYAGPPLALRLPIRDETYGDVESRAFFQNLLQEGWQLDLVATQYRKGRTDVAGLLFYLGKDCPGALSIVPAGSPPVKSPGSLVTDYEAVSDDRLTRDIAALFERKPILGRTRFSLAGFQSKMAITQHPAGHFLEAINGAPSTHIIKVGNRDDESLVENEFLCLKAAAALGLPTIDCAIQKAGSIPYLLVPRYDRAIEGSTIYRLHQEDCCQALGLPPAMKYEKDGDPHDPRRVASFANLFHLSDELAAPIDCREILIKTAFYNYLIGNADAHAKNFSLMHVGKKPILADLYDLVCIALYPAALQDMAMAVGRTVEWDVVERADWQIFLTSAGITGKQQNTVIEKILRPMASRILDVFTALIEAHDMGTSRARLIRDCIGERLHHLNNIMGWDIPVPTDAFVVKGGGWTLS